MKRINLSSITDATFRKDKFLPQAIDNQNWRIVFSEAQHITELTIRGMIKALGNTPRKHHSLKGHVSHLSELIHKKTPPTFTIGCSNNGNGYSLSLARRELRLYRLDDGSLTSLAASRPLPKEHFLDDPVIKLSLTNDSVYGLLNDTKIISATDSTYPRTMLPSSPIQRHIPTHPQRLREVGALVNHLSQRRNAALYAEEDLDEEDAQMALNTMNQALKSLSLIADIINVRE